MHLWENIRLALAGVRSNKMRSFLTMLGIIIGIAAVIAIMTVGDSVQLSVEDSMAQLGANNINVMIQQKDTDDADYGSTTTPRLTEDDYITDEMLTALFMAYPNEIGGFSISQSMGSGAVDIGNLYANVSVSGVSAGYLVNSELEMLAGNTLTAADFTEAKRVALVSDKLVNNLFGGNMQSAIGQSIEVTIGDNFYTFTIAGVYKYEQSAYSFNLGPEKDINTTVYVPLKTAQNQLHSSAGYQSLTVFTQSGVDSEALAANIERFLGNYYRNNQYYGITAFTLESFVESMSTMMNTISLAISIIAGISLLVGGIGVMNIMLVSVTERTREIGTCKALGATNSSIRVQFITEAIILCLIGGIIGVILGMILGSWGANLLGMPTTASISSIAISLGFSMAIGLFFGYYPANKASKMSPIDALRYE